MQKKIIRQEQNYSNHINTITVSMFIVRKLFLKIPRNKTRKFLCKQLGTVRELSAKPWFLFPCFVAFEYFITLNIAITVSLLPRLFID